MLPYELFNRPKVSFHAFCQLLKQQPIQELFQQASIHTCYYVELMNPVMRDYIYNEGKKFNDGKKMRMFLAHYQNIKAHRAMSSWITFVDLRKRAREVATQAFSNLVVGKLQYAIAKWRKVAMYAVATLEIQV